MEDITLLILEHLTLAGYTIYVLGWCFSCKLFTALAPVTWTSRIPNFMMVIINVSAMNVKNATNEITDIKGNTKELPKKSE